MPGNIPNSFPLPLGKLQRIALADGPVHISDQIVVFSALPRRFLWSALSLVPWNCKTSGRSVFFSSSLSPFFCIFIPHSLIVSLQKRSRSSTSLTVVYIKRLLPDRTFLSIQSKFYMLLWNIYFSCTKFANHILESTFLNMFQNSILE